MVHDVAKPELKRYFAELDDEPESWGPLADALKAGKHITFVFGARDTEHNNAVALKAYLAKNTGSLLIGVFDIPRAIRPGWLSDRQENKARNN